MPLAHPRRRTFISERSVIDQLTSGSVCSQGLANSEMKMKPDEDLLKIGQNSTARED